MKLYQVDVAPNPTKVRLYVAEKRAGGAELDIEPVEVKLMKGEQNSPEFLAKNPFGALPVLEFDDGGTLTESLAIIDYLEELAPAPSMWGASPRERARARELERIADLRVLAPLARYIHATNSPLGLAPNAGVAEQAGAVWPKGLAYLDRVLAAGDEFLCGARPTVGDCTLAAALQFARFAKMDLGLADDFPALAAWDLSYRERPAAKDVLVV
ncbi:MAG: glutathione S-transferase family protein [Gammaproteobacteria bacterium]